METLIPILANILAPAVLDFLFGSDESGRAEGTGVKLRAGYNSGIIAKVGYPILERHLEYLVRKNFSDINKTRRSRKRKTEQKLETPQTSDK